MGTRAATERRPIAYYDRALTHPAVICTGMVCVLAGFLGLVAAGLYCLQHNLDPEPVLKYLGPGAVVAAVIALLNGGGVLALLPKLGRIERNTGTSSQPETYSASDVSAVVTRPYAPPGATR